MTNNDFFVQKIPLNFCCEKCIYNTSVKKDFNKHLMTLKHKNRENSDQENNLSQSKLFICNCGKKYKYDTGRPEEKSTSNVENLDRNRLDMNNSPNSNQSAVTR